jgi:hypothetical protein
MRNLEFITRSVASVLANGHALVPIPHQDVRQLLQAADQNLSLQEALQGLLEYVEDGCSEDGYSAVIEARAALKNFHTVQGNV